jgi:hypothetical protein
MDKYLQHVAEKIAVIAGRGYFDEDSTLSLVTWHRQYLEANKLKKRYKVTMFYCNWALHPQLDKDPVPDTLKRLTQTMFNHGAYANDEINEILSLRILRKEILHVLSANRVDPMFFESYIGWKGFISSFLALLLSKPLQWTGTSSQVRYAASLTLAKADLTTLGQDYVTQYGITKDTIFWKAWVEPKGVKVMGPLVLTEQPQDFARR